MKTDTDVLKGQRLGRCTPEPDVGRHIVWLAVFSPYLARGWQNRRLVNCIGMKKSCQGRQKDSAPRVGVGTHSIAGQMANDKTLEIGRWFWHGELSQKTVLTTGGIVSAIECALDSRHLFLHFFLVTQNAHGLWPSSWRSPSRRRAQTWV